MLRRYHNVDPSVIGVVLDFDWSRRHQLIYMPPNPVDTQNLSSWVTKNRGILTEESKNSWDQLFKEMKFAAEAKCQVLIVDIDLLRSVFLIEGR